MPGIELDEKYRNKYRDIFKKNLSYAANLSKEKNITILIEAINDKDIPSYHLNYVSDAIDIIEELKHPYLKLQLDLYHAQIMSGNLTSIIEKSFFGYMIAFITAIIVWTITTNIFEKYKKENPSKVWVPLQWISSGALWSTWIMQDMANIAVVLPRSLNLDQFVLVASTVFFGLGLLFYLKGDRIQEIVTEKSDIIDVRAATVVDFIYACLLYYLKIVSSIPISTTWVFIGLLGGREIAINIRKIDGDKVRAIKLLVKDTVYAFIGLLVSVILAISINENMRNQIFKDFGIN